MKQRSCLPKPIEGELDGGTTAGGTEDEDMLEQQLKMVSGPETNQIKKSIKITKKKNCFHTSEQRVPKPVIIDLN